MGSGTWRVGGAVGLSGGVETIKGPAPVTISSSGGLLSSLGRCRIRGRDRRGGSWCAVYDGGCPTKGNRLSSMESLYNP